MHPAHPEPSAEDPAGNTSPDAEATVPDLKDLDEVATGVLLPARCHRVQAGAYQTGDDRPEPDGHDGAGEPAQSGPSALQSARPQPALPRR